MKENNMDRLMSEYIHISKYSRWLDTIQRRETWEETVDRYISFWVDRIPGLREMDTVREMMLNLKVMPSMRTLMTAGKALERDEIAGYNCTAIAVTHMSVFSESFYILMNGCGFGFSVERQYTNQLPEVAEDMYPTDTVIVVRDSKIGWASALKELISMLYSGMIPTWDTSKVRPAGSRLKTFGGRASGPEPLDKLFKQTVKLITNAKGRKLNSIECHLLLCHIANAVIVGSVRRSALISLSNLTDDRMRRAKTGQWWMDQPDLALSNNSVAYTEKPDLNSFMKEWRNLYQSKSGERGMWNKVGMKKKYDACGRPEYSGDIIPNPSLRKMTKVWTSDGIKPIYQLEGIDFDVRNQHGEIVSAECWKSAENLKLWNIDITGNHTYQCSPQHKWAVLSNPKRPDRSTIIKKRADEIVVGDILIKNGFHDTISNTPSIEGDYDRGLLCGWIIGDGWKTTSSDGYTQYGMIISEDDTINGVKDVMVDILQEQCGWSGDLTNKTEINTCNKKLNTIMDDIGFVDKESGLPSKIWLSSEDVIRGIVDGLFSSDGCVSNGVISIKTSRKQLASDISELLGFYGISNSVHKEVTNNVSFPNGKIYDRDYVSYNIVISGYLNIKHFSDVFKLTHRRKQHLINDMVNNPPNVIHFSDGIRVTGSHLSEESDDVYDIRVHDDTATFQLAYSITGNCGEVSLRDSGQACNLSEIIIRPDITFDEMKEAARVATIIGTLQATLTNLRFLRKIWQNNMEDERLLGVSMTGIMDHPVFSGQLKDISEWTGDKELNTLDKYLKYLRNYCHEVNKEWAEYLGINPTGHVTVCKPSGTVSLLTGTSSGIHPRYAKHYIRRVRQDVKDPLSKLMVDQGVPYVVEGEKLIFSFYIKSPDHCICQDDIGSLKQLDLWKTYATCWADGNPSQTIYYTDDEFLGVADWIWKNWDDIGGLSFFPKDNSSSGVYTNAPLEEITEDQYNECVEQFPEDIDWAKLSLYESDDLTNGSQELSCVGGKCDLG